MGAGAGVLLPNTADLAIDKNEGVAAAGETAGAGEAEADETAGAGEAEADETAGAGEAATDEAAGTRGLSKNSYIPST